MNEAELEHGATDPLLARLIQVCRLEGRFTQRSGTSTTHFFDEYQFQARPALLRQVVDRLAPLVPAEAELVAGLDMGVRGRPCRTACDGDHLSGRLRLIADWGRSPSACPVRSRFGLDQPVP